MSDIKVGDLVSCSYDVDKSGLVVGIIDSPSHPIYDLVRPSVYAIAKVRWFDSNDIDELYLADLKKINCKSKVNT
jgi:hypothetical protein